MKYDRKHSVYNGLLIPQKHINVQCMTRGETQVMLTLITRVTPLPYEEFTEAIEGLFVPQVMIKRIAALVDPQQVATPEVFLMILSLGTNNTPGTAVMWAYTLMLIAAEQGKPTDMGTLCEYYPFGFHTKESIKDCWDRQKGWHDTNKETYPKVDNVLDLPDWWLPLVKTIKENSPA